MFSKKSTKKFKIFNRRFDAFFVAFLENMNFNEKNYDVNSRFSKKAQNVWKSIPLVL